MRRRLSAAAAVLLTAWGSSSTAAPESAAVESAVAASDGSFYEAGEHGEEVEAAADAPLLELYGFIDFTYSKNLDGPDVPFDKFPQFGSFAVGNVNLYASSNLSNGWRSLLEVRFLYLPHGSDGTFSANGAVERSNGNANDYTDFDRTLRWGGIELERVFLEYQATDWLAVQAGQFLTPYGIWNTDHGTPTLVPVRRPFVIGEGLFPERQTGIEAHGALHSGRSTLGYHATVSNGRGPIDSYKDLDDNTAFGGRVFGRTTTAGVLTVGASGYYGMYTDRSKGYGPKANTRPAQLEVKDAITLQFRELTLGADARWEWEDLLVQGEIIANQRVFVDPYRRIDATGPAPDTVNMGGYALLGYRTPWLGIMPYTMAEYYNFSGSALFPPAISTTSGLNIRPQGNVVFKLQYQYAQLGTLSSPELLRGTQHQVDAQAAWAF